MYTIEFYEKSNGESDVWEFLEALRQKAVTNKDARIQYKQIVLYIQLLQDNGTRLPENVTKYLGDGIWELRPGTTVFSISTLKITPLFCSITSARNRKKHHAAK